MIVKKKCQNAYFKLYGVLDVRLGNATIFDGPLELVFTHFDSPDWISNTMRQRFWMFLFEYSSSGKDARMSQNKAWVSIRSPLGGDVAHSREGGRGSVALFSPMSCQDTDVLCPIFFSFLLVPRRRSGEEFSGRLCMASWFEVKELQSSKERKFSFCWGDSVR